MVNEIIERNREIIRQSLDRVVADKIEITETMVSDALTYFERNEDTDKVREQLKKRGALGVRKTEGATGYETYTKQRVAEMIDSGEYEVLTSGLGPRIVTAKAQLFTNPTQYFEFVDESTEEAVEGADDVINAHREAGGFTQALVNADTVSCTVESGPLFVDYKAGHLQYTPVNPANVYFKYHDQVLDNDVLRGVDYTEIDDSACMVIKLAGQPTQIDTNNYLAVFGRSDDLPLGRYVYYTARQWYDIPKQYARGAIEWEYHGEIANPLSVYAVENGGGPEYPLSIFRGGMISTTANTPHPVTTSLYECCLEFDVAFSRLMKDSLSCALGLKVIQKKAGEALPRCLEGAVAIETEDSIQLLSLPIANAVGALDVITRQAQAVAEGFGVPSYLVVQQSTPESGIALAIRTKPLADDLNRRARINGSQVARLFDIEKGLYSVYSDDGKTLVPPGVTQVWKPGRFEYPETAQEKLTRIADAVDKKYMSFIRGIRDYNSLATDNQAKALYDTIEQDNKDYPPPSAATPKAFGAGALTTPGLAPRPPRKVLV